MGLQMGASLVLLLWAVWLMAMPFYADLDCPYCTQYLSATLPVFRIFLVPVAGYWAWCFCVRVFEKQNINYIVRRPSPRAPTPFTPCSFHPHRSWLPPSRHTRIAQIATDFPNVIDSHLHEMFPARFNDNIPSLLAGVR